MNERDDHRTSEDRLCVLLACFAGHKGAAHARGDVVKRIDAAGGAVVDEVIVTVDAKRRARVHDPHRVFAGTLTAALTWGLFGLIAGGDIRGLVVWGVLGALCGGLYAYFCEHLLTKSDLERISGQLTADSSALIAFVETDDDAEMLETVSNGTTIASSAAIDSSLTTHASSTDAGGDAALSMTLLRYQGEHTARRAVRSVSASDAHVELVIEVPASGRPRVVDPSQGVVAMSKSDIVSWGGFGLVVGLLVGFGGGGGLFGALDRGVVTGIAWAAFGLVAGALYGLWAGRATSSRRVKSLRALLPPDTSTAVIWMPGASTSAIDESRSAADRSVTLYFHPSEQGAVVQAS